MVEISAMAKVWPGRRGASRALVTSVVAGLSLLPVLALVLALCGGAIAGPAMGLSARAAGTICRPSAHDDRPDPARPRQLCLMCPVCDLGRAALSWPYAGLAAPRVASFRSLRPAKAAAAASLRRAGPRSSRGPPHSC
ncbi:MAG TPA: hypothetical protein VIG55_01755 [Methylosinus sp.]